MNATAPDAFRARCVQWLRMTDGRTSPSRKIHRRFSSTKLPVHHNTNSLFAQTLWTTTMLSSRIPTSRLLTALSRRPSSLGLSRALRTTCLARPLAVGGNRFNLHSPRQFASTTADESTSETKEAVAKETLEFQAETRQVRKCSATVEYSRSGSGYFSLLSEHYYY